MHAGMGWDKAELKSLLQARYRVNGAPLQTAVFFFLLVNLFGRFVSLTTRYLLTFIKHLYKALQIQSQKLIKITSNSYAAGLQQQKKQKQKNLIFFVG